MPRYIGTVHITIGEVAQACLQRECCHSVKGAFSAFAVSVTVGRVCVANAGVHSLPPTFLARWYTDISGMLTPVHGAVFVKVKHEILPEPARI